MSSGTMADAGGMAGGVGRPSDLPVTRMGKAAAWLALAFTVGFGLNMPLVAVFGRTGAPDWLRPFLPFWGLAIMGVGVAAGICAVIATLKYKERSWAVWIAMVPGGFALLFVLGEFLFPH